MAKVREIRDDISEVCILESLRLGNFCANSCSILVADAMAVPSIASATASTRMSGLLFQCSTVSALRAAWLSEFCRFASRKSSSTLSFGEMEFKHC